MRTQVFFLMSFFLIAAAEARQLTNADSSSQWAYCYNEAQNRIYFQSKEDLKVHRGQCLGRTYYQGTRGYMLITDSVDDKGFPMGTQGSSINMTLKNGRNLLISHWLDFSKSNTAIVLEVDPRSNQVIEHCRMRNYSNNIEARFVEGTARSGRKSSAGGKLLLKIRRPKSELSEEFVTEWAPCRLKTLPALQ